MPEVKTVSELQEVMKRWFRQPNETEDQWRDRVNNDPGCEISFSSLALPGMLKEQEDEIRFENAQIAEPVYPSIEDANAIDRLLETANKKDD